MHIKISRPKTRGFDAFFWAICFDGAASPKTAGLAAYWPKCTEKIWREFSSLLTLSKYPSCMGFFVHRPLPLPHTIPRVVPGLGTGLRRVNPATNKHTNKQTNQRTNKQTSKQTNKQIDQQTNKQTIQQSNKQTNQ
jgi:hypothetical protein